MKFLTSLKRNIQKLSKKARFVATIAVVAATGAVAYAGYTPNRTTYDWNNTAQRQGSMDGPRINAFVNTPYYGDERAFFDARLAENTATSAYKDVLPNVADGTKEIVLRTYIHNGANKTTNASGVGGAKDLKVRIDLPTGTAKALRTRSYVSISNPAPGYPGEVTDTTELVDGSDFSVSYVAGSAKAFNAANPGGAAVNDSIVTSGAAVGYNSMNGNQPGCFEFQTFVEIKVRVKVVKPTIEKLVRVADTDKNTAGVQPGAYGKFVTVKPGEEVEWKLFFKNQGDASLDNVRVADQMPPHMQIVPGSVRWIYRDISGVDKDVVQQDGPLFNGAFTAGTWNAGGGFYIRFDTVAKSDFEACQVTVRNIANVTTTQTPNKVSDYSDVKIVKENCEEPEESFSCDALNVTKNSINSYTFNAVGTVNNTTITAYIFKVNSVVKQETASSELKLTDLAAGTYTVTVQVKTPIGTTSESAACTKMVTVEIPKESVYACESLSVTSLGNRKFSYTLKYTALNGATFKNASYNFGDDTAPLLTDKTTVEHTYANPGTFVTRTKLTFSVNGVDKVVEDAKCVQTVTITNDIENCPVPGKGHLPKDSPECVTPPVELPNTGAGSVIGIFASVTMVGAMAHRFVLTRRYDA